MTGTSGPVVGMGPMPVNLVEASFEQIRKIPGVEVQTIDIRACDNPTFSADGTNVLLGGGLAFSYLHTDTYTKNSWRGRLGGGVAHEGLRAIMTWLTPLSDDNQLQGLELGLRYDYGHLRLGASAAGYQFVEPVGPTRSARVYGGYVGGTF